MPNALRKYVELIKMNLLHPRTAPVQKNPHDPMAAAKS